jgi:hypothetical protein
LLFICFPAYDSANVVHSAQIKKEPKKHGEEMVEKLKSVNGYIPSQNIRVWSTANYYIGEVKDVKPRAWLLGDP